MGTGSLGIICPVAYSLSCLLYVKDTSTRSSECHTDGSNLAMEGLSVAKHVSQTGHEMNITDAHNSEFMRAQVCPIPTPFFGRSLGKSGIHRRGGGR